MSELPDAPGPWGGLELGREKEVLAAQEGGLASIGPSLGEFFAKEPLTSSSGWLGEL